MTIKKDQHIIPIVYQKEFVDVTKPKDFPDTRQFTPAIWQIDKFFELEPTSKSPKNSLTENRFYKLDNDSDERQIIEDSLSKIENNYSQVLRKLKNKNPLEPQELINLIVFIETLHQRTKNQIEHWQNQFNKIEEIYREVDQHHNNNQNFSNEFWKDSHEIGKKLILIGIGAMGELLINEGIYILFNESELPFISSDNPVLWTHGHIDELLLSNLPINWLREEVKTNQKQFFCYCPLTPQIAIFSSPFFKSIDGQVYSYWTTTNAELIFSMNYLTHTSADKIIIANTPNPYGNYDQRIKKYLKVTKTIKDKKGKQMLFYTSNARYWLNVIEYEHIFDNPIKSKIKFWTKDIKTLNLIAKDKIIETVHLYEDGIERGFSRKLVFDKVSSRIGEASVLNQL